VWRANCPSNVRFFVPSFFFFSFFYFFLFLLLLRARSSLRAHKIFGGVGVVIAGSLARSPHRRAAAM
jgi:hypothetical protein